jgi:membrane protein implicated in regulation of membrane protease activity
MKNLKESEKNFLTCAILIALVGIALVFLDQTTLGILSIIAAGVFVAIFFKMVITKKRGKRKTLSKKEKYIDEHLDKTCKLVGKLNNNDIEMIENMRKTKNQDFRNKDDIQREY